MQAKPIQIEWLNKLRVVAACKVSKSLHGTYIGLITIITDV